MVVGGVWVEHVTTLSGKTWDVPQALPRSDGLLDNRPALVAARRRAAPDLLQHRRPAPPRGRVDPRADLRYFIHSGTPPGRRSTTTSRSRRCDVASAPTIRSWSRADPAEEPPRQPVVHPDETGDVARMRDYRIEAGGKTYRLLRGDFHRHTEISMDGGPTARSRTCGATRSTPPGSTGWATTTMTTAAARSIPGGSSRRRPTCTTARRSTPMFTYERSVAYPHGHRNVMFAQRGIRTLPRLVGETAVVDDDTRCSTTT